MTGTDMQAAAVKKPAGNIANFRPMTEDDVTSVVMLGAEFFHESEFPEFSTFAPDHFEIALREMLKQSTFRSILFEVDAKVEGFIFWQMDYSYTKEPMALLYLLYVAPSQRKTPAGRLLVDMACKIAKQDGCCAFYAGAMSGIEKVGGTLPNMYRKLGFKELAFWGKKVLRDE